MPQLLHFRVDPVDLQLQPVQLFLHLNVVRQRRPAVDVAVHRTHRLFEHRPFLRLLKASYSVLLGLELQLRLVLFVHEQRDGGGKRIDLLLHRLMVRTRSVGIAGVELMGVQDVPLVEVAVLVRDPLKVEGHLHPAEVVFGRGHCVLVYFDQLAQG